ncbi:MAG: FAD-dependent oxidoreductase [Myxococcota bacterium]
MLPLTTRVAIIGAGPAGLSAAMALKERGFRDVTVLEKEPEVGGKCHSFRFEGHVYDLGANLTTPRYRSIRALADRLGMTRRKVADRRIVNIGAEQFDSLADASVLERLLVRTGASVYSRMRHLTGIDRNGYRGLRDAVEQPFDRWLQRHGLGAFKELFEVLFVAYGYGQMGDLPAAYALKFFDPIHVQASVDTILGRDVPFTTDFVEGFQELWVRVDREYEIGAKCGVNVRAVRRSPRGVDITWTAGEGPGLEQTERFDKLVLACPFPEALRFLDASPLEMRLFGQVKTNQYFTTVAQVRNMPDLSTYVYPYARRFTPGQPTVFYPPVEGDDDVFVCYAYGGEGVTVDTVRKNIVAAIEAPGLGGKVERFLHTQHWNYFPHVDSPAMQGGFYDDFENMQGEFHTFYVGELLAFTLVELIHDHARQVVDRYFA